MAKPKYYKNKLIHNYQSLVITYNNFYKLNTSSFLIQNFKFMSF